MTTTTAPIPLTPRPEAPSVTAPRNDSNSDSHPFITTSPNEVAWIIHMLAVLASLPMLLMWLTGHVPFCRSFSWFMVAMMSSTLQLVVQVTRGHGWWPFWGFFALFCVYTFFAVGPLAKNGGTTLAQCWKVQPPDTCS